ncbi:porin OmpC [Salmonella enterica]|nr:porin OmpC [Salmonella enterica]
MKSKVALLVLSALALGSTANAAEIFSKDGNKLDLYGKVKGEHDFADGSNADATYARLGFRGETQINDQLTGFGQFEHQFNASGAEGEQGEGKTRLAFAGIDAGEYGAIDYGRNYGVVYDIGAYADNLTEFGGDSYQNSDNFMTGRSTGLLTYRNNKLVDGLQFGLQYQAANEDGRDWKKTNGQGVGASLQYTIAEDYTIGAAYAHGEASSAKDSLGYKYANGDAEIWTVGAKYDANSIYLATSYAEARNLTPVSAKVGGVEIGAFADKTKNFEAMAAYVFDFGLRPAVGYVQSRATIDGLGSEDVVKYATVGASYNFNKNFAVDAAYKFNLVRDELAQYGFATDDQVVVGATYQF